MLANAPAIVLVTDPRFTLSRTTDVIRAAARAVRPYGVVFAVQVRDKTALPAAWLERARALRDVTADEGVPLVVNGSVADARDIGADGVHFASDVPLLVEAGEARRVLGADTIVTAAAHADDDVRRAVDAGVTAVLVSPIYESPGKGPPRGLEALRTARALTRGLIEDGASRPRVRVYALGGVRAHDAADCASAGADGIAVIRALLDAEDPALVARDLAAGLAAGLSRGGRV